jgi:hypothetical protein
MKTLVLLPENMDDIKGVTLEERARLVLVTLGRTPEEIKRAYRKLANRYHPDKAGGSKQRFQILREAYELLTDGSISKSPMLADDKLMVELIGRQIEPLIDRQKIWEEYELWRRNHFYGANGELI